MTLPIEGNGGGMRVRVMMAMTVIMAMVLCMLVVMSNIMTMAVSGGDWCRRNRRCMTMTMGVRV